MLALNIDQDQEIQDSIEWGYEALIEQLDSVVSLCRSLRQKLLQANMRETSMS